MPKDPSASDAAVDRSPLRDCPWCGYDVIGLSRRTACPECGNPIDREWVIYGGRKLIRSKPRQRRIAAILLGQLALAVLIYCWSVTSLQSWAHCYFTGLSVGGILISCISLYRFRRPRQFVAIGPDEFVVVRCTRRRLVDRFEWHGLGWANYIASTGCIEIARSDAPPFKLHVSRLFPLAREEMEAFIQAFNSRLQHRAARAIGAAAVRSSDLAGPPTA